MNTTITQFQIVILNWDIQVIELLVSFEMDEEATGFVEDGNISRDNGDCIITESDVEY